jgi:hypothetical protein
VTVTEVTVPSAALRRLAKLPEVTGTLCSLDEEPRQGMGRK